MAYKSSEYSANIRPQTSSPPSSPSAPPLNGKISQVVFDSLPYIYLVRQVCDESKVLLLYMFTEEIKLNIEKY